MQRIFATIRNLGVDRLDALLLVGPLRDTELCLFLTIRDFNQDSLPSAIFAGGLMSRRKFEMHHYRQALMRMRQGDSDRDLAKSGLMGRRTAAALRTLASEQGWLDSQQPLPEDATIADALAPPKRASTTISHLEPLREQIAAWHAQGVSGVVILAALKREHGYTGSYSAVRRLLATLKRETPPDTTIRLDFAPGEAAQVDFGV